MVLEADSLYTSKIIKAGALLADTKALLAHWDATCGVPENLERLRRDNIFGKASRSRVEDILAIFRQRYLSDEDVLRALVALVRGGLPADALERVFFFHSAQSDQLLHDAVTDAVGRLHASGRTDISIKDMELTIARWVNEGKTTSQWSDYTIRRVSQGLMSTLRDFGVLQGATNKKIAPFYLPVRSFAFIAFDLAREEPSGNRLLHHPEWRLFFMAPDAIEQSFIEAHQSNLLKYQAAGTIVRIDFPAQSLEEYAHALIQRTP